MFYLWILRILTLHLIVKFHKHRFVLQQNIKGFEDRGSNNKQAFLSPHGQHTENMQRGQPSTENGR